MPQCSSMYPELPQRLALSTSRRDPDDGRPQSGQRRPSGWSPPIGDTYSVIGSIALTSTCRSGDYSGSQGLDNHSACRPHSEPQHVSEHPSPRAKALPIRDRRAVVAALLDVVILPAGLGNRVWDPAKVAITWRA
jgi:hypothetical protein